MDLVCIIMAAGRASRFGANKLLADFRGKPLCRWAMEAVPQDCFFRVILVTGYEEVRALAPGFTVIRNDRPELGISRTIRLGLEAAGDCAGALFLTADQPFVSQNTLRGLAEAFRENPHRIYAASHGGKRGNPVCFPRQYFPELQRLDGDTGGAQVIRAHPRISA